ncbi:YlmH/Sll1252 family protein [Mobilibacterium timonense]|uniref:YlmH/Sll1252 family protein n=1 Tax=Mobilibacterium timonense TaxID=1871012 RepID=UPI00098570CB|nr:YlmH/Sll1252 family protein [Mobilibacterium timonense]MBM6990422.1 RNA-binding protein [Mobilibacterium timonense]
MDKDKLLAGRIADLSRQCWNGDYLTHTNFLSASELAEFYQMPGHQHSPGLNTFNGVPYIVFGGREDSDRARIFFLPSYMDADQLIQDELSGNGSISLVCASPVNPGFADPLTHRDYLGALMNLGIDRSMTGDILVNQHDPEDGQRPQETGRSHPRGMAYIFCAENVAELIASELTRVKHTTVSCQIIPPSACDLEPDFRELTGTVASIRLDSIITMVWHLSRGKAQALIQGEKVTVNGRLITSSSFEPGENDRVSVRGLGKFIYLGDEGSTRKGRLRAKVHLFV